MHRIVDEERVAPVTPHRRPLGSARRATRTSTASELLRQRTREAHARAEAAFDVDRRLATRATYTDLLVRLHGYYAPMEDALASWDAGATTPSLGMDLRSRAHLLGADLVQLGRWGEAVPDRLSTAVGAAPLMGLPEALGRLYVLEGSALGGRLVARHARAALGPDVPVAFFTGAGLPDLTTRWRSLQRRLDELEPQGHLDAVDRAVGAAEESFRLFEVRLLIPVPTR
ncbi:biliverdin-producing heme oxygenase [Aquipuribacter sp. MA13-6]|uniref:biliverdin-producing heme oxygenase n=1 Tax=unclassified Aquipuribacter TaxID=2635084 RepID=UPI003EEA633A